MALQEGGGPRGAVLRVLRGGEWRSQDWDYEWEHQRRLCSLSRPRAWREILDRGCPPLVISREGFRRPKMPFGAIEAPDTRIFQSSAQTPAM